MRAYGTKWTRSFEKESRCIVEVFTGVEFTEYSEQCKRKRGHGKEGLYCKQHAKLAEKNNYEGLYNPKNEQDPALTDFY